VHYDHAFAEEAPPAGYNPEWEFGYGLSYTTFAYSDLTVTAGDTIRVSVTVTNTGQRPGVDVVELYTRELYASIAPPVKKLREFRRVSLGAGEKQTLTWIFPKSRLAFIGRDNKPRVEPGPFDVLVGSLSARFMVR
jgi:beta-glucosidase